MKVTSADIHLKDQIFDVNTSKELSATSTGSKASLQVAANWIQNCTKHHSVSACVRRYGVTRVINFGDQLDF